jgi:hypothetical protein
VLSVVIRGDPNERWCLQLITTEIHDRAMTNYNFNIEQEGLTNSAKTDALGYICVTPESAVSSMTNEGSYYPEPPITVVGVADDL